MKKHKKVIILLITVLVVGFGQIRDYIFNNYTYQKGSVNELAGLDDADILKVYYVDVGQGDCTVIELPNDEIMMIDSGENGYEEMVIDFLDSINVKKIDYLIATHPHSDHIGGMAEVIDEYDIGKIYMPDVVHTSQTFKNMLLEIEKKNLSINKASRGKTIFEYPDFSAKILSPVSDDYEDLNNYSAVVKLSYKDNSFLFCGDVEKEVEEELLMIGEDIDCDVIKVAHHGSSTSSTYNFLEQSGFDMAVISCGADNDYGHPYDVVLKRINKFTNKVYRTDKSGNITILSDGKTLKALTQY